MSIDASLTALQSDVDSFLNESLISAHDTSLTKLWSTKATRALKRLVRTDRRLDVTALENFRRDEVLVEDLPRGDFRTDIIRNNFLTNSIIGRRRATRHCLLECLDILQRRGYAEDLRRHPCHPAGNPLVFSHAGYDYTYRWARNVYFLGLMKQVLGDQLDENFAALDIGSSYGIFSGLLKREYPGSTHILVDLPEQLIAARYFLSQYFPHARIAGVSELIRETSIDRAMCKDHDFILLPAMLFDRLRADSADLVTNFGSFCEMSREYFDAYMHSDAFLTCKYFYTINRIEAKPDVHDDITILDYPIRDPQKKLHFDVSPMYSVDFSFTQHHLFFTTHYPPPPFFEYIGRLG